MIFPTLQQMDLLISKFESVLPMAKALEEQTVNKHPRLAGRSVDMCQGHILHDCNTPVCHAGWYVIASKLPSTDYWRGCIQMAEDLGFGQLHYKVDELLTWADKNPDIWGNENGAAMFRESEAFNYIRVIKLEQIVNHWKGVRERLAQYYQKLPQ